MLRAAGQSQAQKYCSEIHTARQCRITPAIALELAARSRIAGMLKQPNRKESQGEILTEARLNRRNNRRSFAVGEWVCLSVVKAALSSAEGSGGGSASTLAGAGGCRSRVAPRLDFQSLLWFDGKMSGCRGKGHSLLCVKTAHQDHFGLGNGGARYLVRAPKSGSSADRSSSAGA